MSVIPHLDGALLCQTSGVDSLARQGCLLITQRNANGINPKPFGGVHYETAPSASNVKKTLAGTEPQLPANVLELSLLSLLEGGISIGEVGAGIHHPFIEPELVEIVSDVVVRPDCRRVALGRVDGAAVRRPNRRVRRGAIICRKSYERAGQSSEPSGAGQVSVEIIPQGRRPFGITENVKVRSNEGQAD